MGLFDTTQETTTTSSYPAGVQQLQADWIDAAGRGMSPWFTNPDYQVAPRNAYHSTAGSGFLDLAGTGTDGSYSGLMAGMSTEYPSLFKGLTGRLDRGVDQSKIGLGDITKFSAPLSKMLNERSDEQIGNQYRRGMGDIANQEAAGAGFSGMSSVAALRRAQLDKNALEASKDAAMGNESSAYQMGASLAGSNADRYINALAQSGQFDTNALAQAFNSGIGGLQAAEGARTGGIDLDSRLFSLINAFANERQGHEQDELDAPYTTYSRFVPQFPSFQANTTSSSSQNPSLFSTVGNIAQTFLPFL